VNDLPAPVAGQLPVYGKTCAYKDEATQMGGFLLNPKQALLRRERNLDQDSHG
jgi:hypothetical protein